MATIVLISAVTEAKGAFFALLVEQMPMVGRIG
jgi:hypothetical protein